jgi:3,4-dihydroxy 2-butanone 4-phosphate synthase/GTP cyclohydrolase II
MAQTGAVWRIASTPLPTKWGMFEAIGFEREVWAGGRSVETAVALVLGDLREGVPLVRVHSQCLTGAVFGSLRCDCAGQLNLAMQAYELQDAGIDTIEANHALGFKADLRNFGLAAEILRDLRIPRVRLLTNNPRKVRAIRDNGIEVVERIPCEIGPTVHSLAYLQTKKQKMGHALALLAEDPA